MMPTVTDSELLVELKRLFRDALGVDPIVPIDRETRFFADLGLASIDAVVLGEAIGQHFERLIPFPELMADLGRREQRDLTIGELLDFLLIHVGQPTGPAVDSEMGRGHAPSQGE
ncbi:MAG: acyl carrier protein [Isosphaeraceae bacterium]